ncbi:hypothetical protein [Streptomyces sp. NPDC017993]|uniref:hypothetical protein n=1 Tax=Streptomyces sp. NPDC017993 TaxID=3365027 RepID=UPI0037ABE710
MDLSVYGFDHGAQSLVNHSPYMVKLYEEAGGEGEHLDIGPTRCPPSLARFATATGEHWSRRASSINATSTRLRA